MDEGRPVARRTKRDHDSALYRRLNRDLEIPVLVINVVHMDRDMTVRQVVLAEEERIVPIVPGHALAKLRAKYGVKKPAPQTDRREQRTIRHDRHDRWRSNEVSSLSVEQPRHVLERLSAVGTGPEMPPELREGACSRCPSLGALELGVGRQIIGARVARRIADRGLAKQLRQEGCERAAAVWAVRHVSAQRDTGDRRGSLACRKPASHLSTGVSGHESTIPSGRTVLPPDLTVSPIQ